MMKMIISVALAGGMSPGAAMATPTAPVQTNDFCSTVHTTVFHCAYGPVPNTSSDFPGRVNGPPQDLSTTWLDCRLATDDDPLVNLRFCQRTCGGVDQLITEQDEVTFLRSFGNSCVSFLDSTEGESWVSSQLAQCISDSMNNYRPSCVGGGSGGGGGGVIP
jgi:hypothetical protein